MFSKRYLSLLIQDSSIKVAQVRKSGKVERFARLDAVSDQPEDIVAALKRLLQGFDRRCKAVCVIASNAGSTKSIEVPSQDPSEIKSIIGLQATRYTPYSKEEIIVGFAGSSVNKVNQNSQGLLVIVNKKAIQDRLAICEKAGLNIEYVCFAPEAMGRFYVKAWPRGKTTVVKGVLDFTAKGIDFMVVRDKAVVFSRNIPLGIQSILQEESKQSAIIQEIAKSIESYVHEDLGPAPSEFVITTAHEAVKNFLPVLTSQLNINCVVMPFNKYCQMSKAQKKQMDADFADDSFLDVIAAGVMGSSAGMNLLPDDVLVKRQFDKQSRDIAFLGVIAAILFVMVGVLLLMQVYFKDMFLNKNLRQRYAPEQQQAADLKAQQARNLMIKKYLGTRILSLEVLNALYDATPKEVYLSNVVVDDTGAITIEGVSDTMSRVFTYTQMLEDSAMFKTVKTKNTATRKDQGKDVAVFEITMMLESSKGL